LVAGLIVLLGVVLVPAFQRPAYWLTLSRQYFAPAALALVLTPIVLTGGIDLSVGSVTVCASVVIGVLTQEAGWPIGWAMAAGALTGLLAGLANGALITVGVIPLVATLATRELFRGLAYTLVGDSPVRRLPPIPGNLWGNFLAGLPLAVYGIALLFVAAYLVVHHTWIGRMIYAVGDNEQAARFAGVPVRRLKLGLYACSGLVAGVCGAGLVMEYESAKADAEKTLELVAIACVVLGGIRIAGGAGHVAGTLLGIVTITVLGAALTSVAPNWRDTVTGGLLIVVAVTNEATARWSARWSVNYGVH
jgi:ribose/xylose/arabinose/galactoside ABC-type transport system permease subunit